MAFYGTLEENNFTGLSTSVSDTATDVFVYDTRKDSDGGAWRYRTQNTSWYNETLNTATRGSRREFPAVAVIVTTNSGTNGEVIIYDGDDPDMPMWMKFNVGFNAPNQRMIGVNTLENLTSSMMLNAKLVVGTRDGAAGDGGVYVIDFISDNRLLYQFGGYNGPYIVNQIANRNVSTSSRGNQYGNVTTLISGYINDIAMTVLPNAPIDSATGLPVPTIAVANDGGVSVIKDDGTVINDTYTPDGNSESGDIQFFNNGYISTRRYLGVDGNNYHYVVVRKTIPSTTTSSLGSDYWLDSPSTSLGPSFLTYSPFSTLPASSLARNAIGHGYGFTLLDENSQSAGSSLVAYASTSYNTGWMHGNCKGAFLSDTDATNVTGTELVTNGTFDTDTSGWSGVSWNGSVFVSDPSVISQSSGQLLTTSSTGKTYPIAEQSFSTVVGKKYVVSYTQTANVTFNIIRVSTTNTVGLVNSGTNSIAATTNLTGSSSGTITFTATTTTTWIKLYTSDNGNGVFDNISVRLAEEDRSVNNKGLQVFGTITKSAVATGADLVAYSGFSTSNYLFQPYNSALDFGTGDFSVMGWARSNANSASTQGIVFRGIQNSDYGFAIRRTTSGGATYTNSLWVQVSTSTLNDNSTINGIANTTMLAGVWNHICLLRRSGVVYVYFNGSLVYSATNAGTLTPATLSNGTLQFGIPNVTSNEMSIALWRISATAPSADQIKKIYEDEKVLFQENSKAVLYGSSNAVTALAYDDTTKLLHVGTSSGRSDFQGLRRINNTTTAVTTAISATNGLVAEQ